MSKKITIDSGNTHTKIGIFENGKFLKMDIIANVADLPDFLPSDPDLSIIISSVNNSLTDIKNFLLSFKKCFYFDYKTNLPIFNLYESPQTLGMDRLAAAVGANYLYKNSPCLIIDAGSCITYDIIDGKANYLGGGISPGLNIRFKSLHAFTSKLPLLSLSDVENTMNVNLIGTNTNSSIYSGVVNGMIAEVNSIIESYQNLYPDLKILICGGDANYFESKIKQPIFAIPELVHWGLYRILEYNESEF